MEQPYYNKPCAAQGLTSYRYTGKYGFVMIGAKNTKDALEQAKLSCGEADIELLDVWNGNMYIRVSERPLTGVLKIAGSK